MAPVAVRLDGVVLDSFAWGEALELRLVGLDLVQGSGEQLARVDGAKLRLAPGLFRGDFTLLALELDGLELDVTRSEDGKLDFAVGEVAGSDAPAPGSAGAAALLDQWLDPAAEGGIARLERVRLEDFTLRVEDRSLGLTWTTEGADLELRREPARIDGELTLELLLEDHSAASSPLPGARTTGLRLEGGYDLATRRLAVEGEIDRLVPARLLPELRDPLLAACLEQPVRGTFQLATDPERRASIAFQAGSEPFDLTGTFAPSEAGATAVRLDLARLEAWRCAAAEGATEWDDLRAPLVGSLDLELDEGAVRAVRFEVGGARGAEHPGRLTGVLDLGTDSSAMGVELELHQLELWRLAKIRDPLAPLDRLRLAIDGRVTLRLAERRLESLALDLAGVGGELRLPIAAEPVAIGAWTLRAEGREGLADLRVEEARVALGDRELDLTLEARRRDGAYQGRLDGTVGGGSVAGLLALWPPDLASGARVWVEENLDGMLGDARIALEGTLDDGAAGIRLESIDGGLTFDGVAVHNLLAGHAIEDLEGSASFSRDRIGAEVRSGRVGELRVEPAQVTILDPGGAAPRLETELDFAAPVEAALEIAAADPIGLDVGPVSGLRGSIAGHLRLELPLAEDSIPHVSLGSTLEGLTWSDGPVALDGARGNLELELRQGELEAHGGLDADGVEARFDVSDDGVVGGSPLVVRMRGTIDGTGRRALGLDVEPYLSGETSVEAEYTVSDEASSELRARADLGGTVLDLAALGWRKEADVPGTATLSARRDLQGAWTIDDLELDAGDLDARGGGRFTVDPFLVERARLDRLAFPGGDLRVEIVRGADGGYRIAIAGEHFDAGPALTALGGGVDSGRSGPGPSPEGRESEPAAIALEVTLARLVLGGTRTLHDVEAKASLEGATVRSLVAAGRMDPEGVVRLELGSAAEGVRLRLETDALGRALEVFQGTAEIAGGQAWIEASGPSFDGPFDGAFSATDFTVVEQPILARILALGSLEGLVTMFTESGIAIDSLDGALRLEERHLEIDALRAEGPTLVLGLDGAVDLAESTLDLVGMVTRNGLLKRLVGRVPVLKWLLKVNPATIAARFHVEGSLDDPQVRAQPLSSLTPELAHDVLELLSPRSDGGRGGPKAGGRDAKKKKKK